MADLYRLGDITGSGDEDALAWLVDGGGLVKVEPPEDMPDAKLAWVMLTENADGTQRVWDWEMVGGEV